MDVRLSDAIGSIATSMIHAMTMMIYSSRVRTYPTVFCHCDIIYVYLQVI